MMKIQASITAVALCALSALTMASCSSSASSATSAAQSTSTPSSTTTTSSTGVGSIPGGSTKGVARSAPVTKLGIPYATASPNETLDLYLPASSGSKPVPIVVLIHGGAFKIGDSTMEATHAEALVQQGIAAASVNYRLSGEALFPAGAQDVKAAVRWLRAHASQYGLDPSEVGAWGESAGGWMANMLGATGDQKTIFDNSSLGNSSQSSAVQAVVSWYGPSDFATMDAQAALSKCASPQVHGTADSPESQWLGGAVNTSSSTAATDISPYVAKAKTLPAWYLAHGDSDCQVPGGQSLELKDALAKRGVTASYHVLAGAGHMDPAFEQTQLQPSIAFLKTALSTQRQ